ncbi:hypothetical protein Taro_013868 [Colocasia esculenta]|uniref:PH domain-containing protein n=1 Tax=Colocasia esculenta TaxID=4460 RepID=A0A843U7K4_COLES|nr:hypothetical protein [Colocasia esculenta]
MRWVEVQALGEGERMSPGSAKMQGWLYLIRSNRFGLQYSRKRYFVLDGNSLNCFKSVPSIAEALPYSVREEGEEQRRKKEKREAVGFHTLPSWEPSNTHMHRRSAPHKTVPVFKQYVAGRQTATPSRLLIVVQRHLGLVLVRVHRRWLQALGRPEKATTDTANGVCRGCLRLW